MQMLVFSVYALLSESEKLNYGGLRFCQPHQLHSARAYIGGNNGDSMSKCARRARTIYRLKQEQQRRMTIGIVDHISTTLSSTVTTTTTTTAVSSVNAGVNAFHNNKGR